MKISNIIQYIEELAPLNYQEDYDNAGLIVGSTNDEVNSALICLDVTEKIIDEAIADEHKLIISHHPLIFSGLKKINGKNEVERCIIKAIRNKIAIYAAHTNLDNVEGGVNTKICEKLNLINCRNLSPKSDQLCKLVVFTPISHSEKVRNAIFKAGAGNIGNYDSCGFSTEGKGTFRAGYNSNPYVGEHGKLHIENEIRLETIFTKNSQSKIISAMLSAHPYQEVAYDIYQLNNTLETVGIGIIGELEQELDEKKFLKQLKDTFGCSVIRHSEFLKHKIKKVAVCGGAGSFLINKAKALGADIFITGDLKYHDFFLAERKILLADIGHYESEQFTQDIFSTLLTEKLPNFVVRFTKHNTNAVNYMI